MALGQMADNTASFAATYAWFAIARLDQSRFEERKERRDEDTQQCTTATAPEAAPRERRRLHELPLSQRAGMLCNEPAFWTLLKYRYADECRLLNEGTDSERAALILRSLCKVKSRSELSIVDGSGQRFIAIECDYQLWMNCPELMA